MKFEKIQAGMILYDRHKQTMGNTTMKELGEWPVVIVSIDHDRRLARCRWNGNPANLWSARDLEKLKTWSMYDECAEVVRSSMLNRVISVKLKKGFKAPAPRLIGGIK